MGQTYRVILGYETEKVMYENDTLNLAMLFKDNSR